MTYRLRPDDGSFRDPSGQVYRVVGEQGEAVVRGLRRDAAAGMAKLLAEPFFRELVDDGDVVETALLDADDPYGRPVLAAGWDAAVRHAAVPFVTWPYEWPFSMLRDAALLQLRLLETSVTNGWMLKDATPFNVQWRGVRPTFVDAPSFVPRDGGYWQGYRQFCATFLTPLLLTAHLGIPFQPLLRSRLDGVPPDEAVRYFRGLRRFKRGVPSHVWFPAAAESGLRRRRRKAPASRRWSGRQPRTALLALLDNLQRLIAGLSAGPSRSDWARYADSHSYDDTDYGRKRDFVERHAAARRPRLTWDLGANTGVFSRIAARSSGAVVAVDGNPEAVDLLYRRLRAAGGDAPRNVVPLVMDVANPSPGQGWAGRERAAFEARGRPDLVLCLALMHHLRVSANVPLARCLEWLRSLDAAVILEFVGREDEMFRALVEHRREDFPDYTAERFEAEVRRRFRVVDRRQVKGGARELLLLEPDGGPAANPASWSAPVTGGAPDPTTDSP